MSEDEDPIEMLRRTLAVGRPSSRREEVTLTEEGSGAPAVTASRNAVEVTRYDAWRAGEVMEGSEQLREKINLGADRQAAVEDFHTLAYSPAVRLQPRCENALRGDFVRTLLETPDYAAMHGQTQCDANLSALATHRVAEQFAKLVTEQQERERERKRRKKKPTPQQKQDDAAEDEMACALAAGRAIAKAQEKVQEYQDAARAFGVMGEGPGTVNDPRRAMRLFQQVNNSQLRRILELAGRFRNVARAKQQSRPNHGNDIFASFEMGDNIPRLLPHELAKLTDQGDVGDIQCARYLERSLMQRSFKKVNKEAKGPIIVLLDESGSMGEGVPNGAGATFLDYAKAFALGMIWIARTQKRWIALVGWSSSGQVNPFVIPPGGIQDDQKMLDWLGHFFDGGTVPPLAEMEDIYKLTGAPAGRTDVIMVTDDVCEIDPSTALAFKEWKKTRKVKMVTIAITFKAGNNVGGGLREVSDDFYRVDQIEANGSAVGAAFSI